MWKVGNSEEKKSIIFEFKIMKAVILAAGRGTRMGKLSEKTPKPLLEINNKPKLAYTVEQLPDEITEVIFVVGYLGQKIKDYFGTEFANKKITYVEQIELNGTGGAVMLTKNAVGKEKFLVLMGDDLYSKNDLREMLNYDFAALSFSEVEDISKCAVLKTDQKGFLTEIIEAPHNLNSGNANTGAYVLSPEFFDWQLVPKQEGSNEYGLPQTLTKNKGDNKVKVVSTKNWFPIGTPEALDEAKKVIHHFEKINK